MCQKWHAGSGSYKTKISEISQLRDRNRNKNDFVSAITCWVEAAFAIRDYFKDGDVELSSLVSPVVFSLVPVASIWFQLFESNFIIGGSGIVLFLNLISGMLRPQLKHNQSRVGLKKLVSKQFKAILFFPTSITAGHFFTKADFQNFH